MNNAISNWKVNVKPRAISKNLILPPKVKEKLHALLEDLEKKGYIQKDWPNYSALDKKAMTFHCHIKKGRPTYVVCWQVIDKNNKKIEVYYVGTHENAPY